MRISKRSDIVGERFSRLIAISPDGKLRNRTAWKCKCDCGQEKIATLSDLRSGKVKSCGCLHRETAAKNSKITHGMTRSRLWNIWSGMKRRCKANEHYKDVSVCDEWLKFEAFRDWALANGYSDELTIDRIDPYGDYEPNNCRWATYTQQENNRRNNRFVTCGEKTQTLAQWAKETGIAAATLAWRISAGWPDNDLFIEVNLGNSKLRKERRKNA